MWYQRVTATKLPVLKSRSTKKSEVVAQDSQLSTPRSQNRKRVDGEELDENPTQFRRVRLRCWGQSRKTECSPADHAIHHNSRSNPKPMIATPAPNKAAPLGPRTSHTDAFGQSFELLMNRLQKLFPGGSTEEGRTGMAAQIAPGASALGDGDSLVQGEEDQSSEGKALPPDWKVRVSQNGKGAITSSAVFTDPYFSNHPRFASNGASSNDRSYGSATAGLQFRHNLTVSHPQSDASTLQHILRSRQSLLKQ